MLEQLDTTAAVFGGSMIRDSKVFRRFAGSLKQGQHRIRCPGKKGLAVEDGSRLHELERRTEVTPSRQLEIIGRLEAIDC